MAHPTSSFLPVVVPATIPADAQERLATGTIGVVGRMPNASNATFLVTLDDPAGAPDNDQPDDRQPYGLAIYKPERGEQPLWDFPAGLFRREVAAFRLSAAAGFGVIPPTVVRTDAPFGDGSLQWFVDADFSEHYLSLVDSRPDLIEQFQAMAALDVIANNTDRKSGHCLFEPAADRVWGIDNGLCFSLDARLRTVIWEFAGEPIPPGVAAAVAAIAHRVPDDVAELLAPAEAEAIGHRASKLASAGTYPFDESGRGYPWPLL